MIDKDLLRRVIVEKLSTTDCFLVDITISNDNSIVVEIDSETSVDLNFCVELTHYIEQHFDREKEDYSLEIGSYSITNPFVDKRQYIKNIGRSVEILTDDRKKIKGTLIEASNDGFVVETEVKELLDGQKRKKTVKKQISFLYNNVKMTKLDF